VKSSACSTVLRRFAGADADELAVLCRPTDRSLDAVQQAQAAYRALAAALAAHAASFRDLTCETLFLRDVGRDLPLLLDVRSRILAEGGDGAAAPLPAFIQQPPLDAGAHFELSASAVVPRNRDAWSVRDVGAAPSCGCAACARSGARIVRLGDQTSVHTANVYGVGRDAGEQARNMFHAAERLLEQCGMGFRDVVRCWIHLRDIDRDYGALNEARRAFFQHCGIERRPASTGIEGIPFPDVHDFSLTVYAVKSGRPLDATPMSSPTLNEAWTYGADFSRGLRLVDANKIALYVSGTASIDEAGQVAHVGDVEGQVERMLHNIASLLAQQGATFDSLVSGVVYVKTRHHAPLVRSMLHERGFDGFPCTLVEAKLCRPELLCEAEAVAMLPLADVRA
jgi:enamine deaminase RidA (YjgF/YER057c/UK114 family)